MKTFLPMLCGALLILCCACGKRIRVESIDIVPKPMSVQISEGIFDLNGKTPIVLLSEDTLLNYSANEINRLVHETFNKDLKVVTGTEPQAQAINLALGDLQPEEYTLSVHPDRINITGGSPAGLFYGVETLRQLMPVAIERGEKASVLEIPVVAIADKPHFAYRGSMLDVCRHFFDVDQVKRYIDILAMHKINRFHWHLTDDQGWRIEIKQYPELTRVGAFRDRNSLDPGDGKPAKDAQPYGGFYTQDQIRDVVQYAAERFITVVPEIEMPGHASAALAAYPYLGCAGKEYVVPSVWGVKEDVYCAGKDSTFTFMENVLTEVIPLFPSEYIHLGGDECPKTKWAQCPQCKQRIKTEKLKDEKELQSYFVQRMEKFLNSKGRKLIGWDEILEGGLSKTATVMSWRGSAGGIEAAKRGNQVIMSPNTYCYYDYYQSQQTDKEPKGIGGFVPVEKAYALDPYQGLNADEQSYIMGVQCNLWTEFISEPDHLLYMLLPRLAALSEVGWSYGNQDFDDFKQRVTKLTQRYDAKGYPYGKHLFVSDSTAMTPATPVTAK